MSSALTPNTPLESAAPDPSAATPAQPTESELKLNGVVEGIGEPFAIINDRIVRLGEYVEGAVLLSVGSNKATLRSADEEELVLSTSR